MHSVYETLRLLQRSTEISHAVSRRGLVRIEEEQELLDIQTKLQRFPRAVAAVECAAQALRRPAEQLTAADVLQLETRPDA